MKDAPLALTFADVSLVPLRSRINSRADVSTSSRFSRSIELEVPIVAANMDTVTMAPMAIEMARLGGIAVIHRFLSVAEQVYEIEKVKRNLNVTVEQPYCLYAGQSYEDAVALAQRHGVSSFPVVRSAEDQTLVGLLTARDLRGGSAGDAVDELMTPAASLVVGYPGIALQEARKDMLAAQIEKLPLADDNGLLTGLITLKDIDLLERYPLATRDSQGRLRVAAAIGVRGGYLERAAALVEAGCDALVLDIAHGHAEHALRATEKVKEQHPDVDLVVGNIATADAVRDLAAAGADSAKAGIGPGCFAAGTRVLMANGLYKNIEDVVPGDRVINMEGRAVDVIGARCSGWREVVAYRHSSFYQETWATPDHQHFIGDLSTVSAANVTNGGYAKHLSRPTRLGESKLQWKELEGVNERDVFLAPRVIDFELPEALTINILDYAKKPWYLERYRQQVTADYNLGYVFGFFLGDGNARLESFRNSERGSVHWALGEDEIAERDRLIAAIASVTGVTPSYEYAKDRKLCRVHLYSIQWARLLSEFGKGTQKALPDAFLCSDYEYLRGLLDGLVDSDGHLTGDGRLAFDNTSPALIELFGVLCYLVHGSFPNSASKGRGANGLAGGLGCSDESMNPAWTSRLNVSHEKRLLDDFQIMKRLPARTMPPSDAIPVYDIEVDCPTHSFIANNVVVHNSACTTRIVAGVGVPQWTVVNECADLCRELDLPLIADGGIREPGDVAKAIGVGADTVMIGSLLAGTDESPGAIVNRNGKKCKVYRGMASSSAAAARLALEGRGDALDQYVAEGTEMEFELKGPVAGIINQLVGGLRSGMSYSDSASIEEFWAKAQFVRQTEAGRRESKPLNMV